MVQATAKFSATKIGLITQITPTSTSHSGKAAFLLGQLLTYVVRYYLPKHSAGCHQVLEKLYFIIIKIKAATLKLLYMAYIKLYKL